MWHAFTFRPLLAILAAEAARTTGRVIRAIVPGVLAILTSVAILAALTYETRYTDASGSRCLAFSIGNREADLCSGDVDRPAPWPPALPVAYPFDWKPADASTEGGAK